MSTMQLIGTSLAIVAVTLFLSSIATVRSGSVGAVFRFKKFRKILKPGLHFVWPVVDRVGHFSTQIRQNELPDEPEYIDRVNDNPEEGKTSPFRVLHPGREEARYYRKTNGRKISARARSKDPKAGWEAISYTTYTKDDGGKKRAIEIDSLHDPITGEYAVVVEWYLPELESNILQYIENVTPSEGRRGRDEEVRKRLEDMADRTLQEVLSLATFGHAREMLPFFNSILKHNMEILVGEKHDPSKVKTPRPWGIRIRDAYIKKPHPGHTVNKARADAAAESSAKQGKIRAAEATATATKIQADADRYKDEQKGKGEASRIKAVKAETEDAGGRFIAALDVAAEVLPKSKVVVMPSDIGAIAGILTLGREVIAKDPEPPTTT